MTSEILNGMIRSDIVAKCKLREIEKLKGLREQITVTLKDDVVQSSGGQDKLGELTARILDLEAELLEDVNKGVRCREDFEKLLSNIDSPQEYEIMHRRYVQFQSFGRIAREMHFSKTAVQKIHSRALQRINNQE